jgi:hypothetical protein
MWEVSSCLSLQSFVTSVYIFGCHAMACLVIHPSVHLMHYCKLCTYHLMSIGGWNNVVSKYPASSFHLPINPSPCLASAHPSCPSARACSPSRPIVLSPACAPLLRPPLFVYLPAPSFPPWTEPPAGERATVCLAFHISTCLPVYLSM